LATKSKSVWPRRIGVALVAIAALPLCALMAARTDAARARARRLLVEVLHDEVGLDATLADLDVEVLPPAVVARGITLDDPRWGRFASAESLRVQPSLLAVLRGVVDLESVEVARPAVRLVIRDGAVQNLPKPRTPSGGGGPLPFADVAVDDALLVVDAAPHAEGELSGVDLDLTVTRGDVIELRVRTTHGTVRRTGGTEAIDELDARARITPNYVQVHALTLRSTGVSLGARRVRLPMPLGSAVSGHADVRADLAHLATLPHGLTLPPVRGFAELHGDVRWSAAEGVAGAGRVVLDDVVIKQFGTGDAELEVDVTDDRLAIRRGTVRLVKGGGVLRLAGTVGLKGSFPVDVDVDIDELEFPKLLDQLGVTPNAIIAWTISGRTELEGTLVPLAIDGPIHTRTHDVFITKDAYHVTPRRRVMSVARGDIDGRMSFHDEGLRFYDLVARTAHSRMAGSVLLGFDDALEVRVHADRLDAADITPLLDFPMTGAGPADLTIVGTYSDQQIGGHLDLRGFSFDGKPMGDLVSDWQLEKDGLAARFPMIDATKNGSRYRAEDFVLDFSDDRLLVTTRVHLDAVALADFYEMMTFEGDERFTPYQGLVQGTADVRYTLGFPGDLERGTLVTDLEARMPTATFTGYAFTDGVLSMQLRWKDWVRGIEGAELDVHHAVLHKGDGTITADGHMTLGGLLDFTAVADRVALRDLEGIGDRFPQLEGVVGGVARIGGTASKQRHHIDAQFTGVAWNGVPLGDARTYVRLSDPSDPWVQAAARWDRDAPPEGEPCAHARMGLAHADWAPDPPLRTRDGLQPALAQPMAFLVCGEGFDGHASMDLAFGRTSSYPVRGRMRAEGFDLAPFLPSPALRGTVSTRVDLRGGSLMEDDSLVGRVVVDALRFGTGAVELRNDGDLDVRVNRGSFEVAQARLIGPSSRLEVRGGGSLRRLATTVDGEIDLGLLASLSPSIVEARGRVGVQVRLSGPAQNPEVYGVATIDDGALRTLALPEPVEDFGGRVTFSQRIVNLENFHARIAGGRLDAHGTATIADRGLDTLDVELTARDLALRPMEGMELGFGADTRVRWARGARLPELGGTLRVSRLLYTRPVHFFQTLTEISRRSRTEVERYDPANDHIAFDLRVIADAPIAVANNLLDAELSIDDAEQPFRVVGTDQRFGIVGKLDLDRGVARFRSANFDVQRGSEIRFSDESRIEPEFDVRAVTTVRRSGDFSVPQWRITLRAHGTGDSLRLETQSEPDLSQEDVALLLTIGMTRAEAQQLQAGSLGQTAALEALATVTGVDREVRNAVPVIDDFRFSSSYSLRTNRSEPQISIGKRITERVRLSATTGLGEAREFRTSVEWRLDDQASVQAGYDNLNNTTNSSLGNLGVDVRWRLEFE
jgi:translocation and assembly module TamB